MLNILFLCTGNTCRSKMAEGYTKAIHRKTFIAYSAGVETQERVNPLAVQVMLEDSIDISDNKPQKVQDLMQQGITFDYVVTVCDHAKETCPVFSGKTQRLHQSFPDPPQVVCDNELTSEAALEVYRDVRDQIKTFVQALPQTLGFR